jgi:hypothetical protein
MVTTNHKKKKYILRIVLVVLLGSACIERTTLPETTEVMRREAEQYGVTHGKETPPNPFVYDGCTFFVDSFMTSDLRTPCLTHDIAYWYGGTKEARQDADTKLREDVARLGVLGKILAYPVYVGVRIFGDSILTKSVDAEWGFGWDE